METIRYDFGNCKYRLCNLRKQMGEHRLCAVQALCLEGGEHLHCVYAVGIVID